MYSLIETRGGISVRCANSQAPARRIARKTESIRRKGPVLDKGGGDVGIEPFPVGGDAAHDTGEKCRIGLCQRLAFELLAETVTSEFAHDRLGVEGRVQLELIEGLDCGKARDGATAPTEPRPPLAGRIVVRRGHPLCRAKRRFSATSARHARTAAPAWSRPSGAARANACASFSQVRMP